MTVYVDDVAHAFGRMKMCHLWADTVEELHAFAARLGLRREWFQEPPKASWQHYDISLGKKRPALKLGAVLTDAYGPVEHVARLTGNTAKLEMVAGIRARRERTASRRAR